MSRWFRWHEGTCEDGKFRAIAVTVGVTPVTVIGLWAMILEDASHNFPRGIATRGLTFWHSVLGLERVTCEKIINEMENHGLVTWTQDGDELLVNNWKKRQFESDINDPTAASRQKAYRDRKRHVSETECYGSVTAELRPEYRVQITDTEKKDKYIGRSRSATRPPSDSDFEEFRKVYPKRAGTDPKAPALKKFQAAVRGGAAPAEIIAGAERYAVDMRKSNKIGTEFVKQSMTWLSQRLWEDYAAQGPPAKSWRDEMHLIDEQLARAGHGKTTGDSRREGADNIVELRKEGDSTCHPEAQVGRR